MSLISKLLEKRGIQSVNELSVEERTDLERWKSVLSQGEITVEKIAEFCKNQKNLIEVQWSDTNNSLQKNERLLIYHTIYSKIIRMIEQPQAEKEALEKHLRSLIVDEK